jgi:hypothetical protein
VEDTLLSNGDLFSDLRKLSAEDCREKLGQLVAAMQSFIPDPRTAPSWQVHCANLYEDEFVLLIGAQHLEFDGAGLSVFVDELRRTYAALLSGKRPELPSVVPYSAYAAFQESYGRGQLLVDRSYFEGLFTGVVESSWLPCGSVPRTTVARPSRKISLALPFATADQLAQAAESGIRPAAMLLSTYARMISEITGQNIVTVTLIRSARVHEEFSRTIGPFTMPMPIPVSVKGRTPKQLAQLCNLLLENFAARADYPSTDLLENVPAFAELPFDTYFSDFGLNITSYRKPEVLGWPETRILEVIGDVPDPEFSSCKFGELDRIPGFHVIGEISATGIRTHYWYHCDRVPDETANTWIAMHQSFSNELISQLSANGVAGCVA